MHEALSQYALHATWLCDFNSQPSPEPQPESQLSDKPWPSTNLPINTRSIQNLEVNAGTLHHWKSRAQFASRPSWIKIPHSHLQPAADALRRSGTKVSHIRFHCRDEKKFIRSDKPALWNERLAPVFADMRSVFQDSGVEVENWELGVEVESMLGTAVVFGLVGGEVVELRDERPGFRDEGFEEGEGHLEGCKRVKEEMREEGRQRAVRRKANRQRRWEERTRLKVQERERDGAHTPETPSP